LYYLALQALVLDKNKQYDKADLIKYKNTMFMGRKGWLKAMIDARVVCVMTL